MLVIAFSLLIGLSALTGFGVLRRARGTYRDVSALNEQYRRIDRALSEIGTGISATGLLARDYLIDSSTAVAADYQARLGSECSKLEGAFGDLAVSIPSENKAQVDRLREEVNGYCGAIEPLFATTDEGGAVRTWSYLRRQVRRRREAVFSMTTEISELAAKNLERQRREIDARQNAMAIFIRRMLALTLLLSGVIAVATLVRMNRLEKRSDEQRRRTEAAEQELRQLSRQLVDAQEAERKSISRELHDEVGQMLTALRMELRNLRDLRTATESEFNAHADSAKRLAEQSLRALKDLAMGLRPSMLDDLGLGSAIQWQVRQFSKHTGIPVDVRIQALPASLPERHRTCIYRLVQEALTNAARHAHAKSIHVAVLGEDGQISVSVRDDGAGFDPGTARGRGLGLLGMHERVLELRGELKLTSAPRRGTLLAARIPVGEEAMTSAGANSPG